MPVSWLSDVGLLVTLIGMLWMGNITQRRQGVPFMQPVNSAAKRFGLAVLTAVAAYTIYINGSVFKDIPVFQIFFDITGPIFELLTYGFGLFFGVFGLVMTIWAITQILTEWA
ncbi:hypothetical protein C2R22_05990 [Salinigranum rubrum]|uniref:Uncharacterized protein n=1 Tax=Salinigranum rubrum TaxID=755307 RepID=A0A2I8VJN2_9EURY|nr:hypothetical protein [Salinigranum rubrum]AUV81269.1 hypothetical protein C2R22_05990 [Salinigranum rubrum]